MRDYNRPKDSSFYEQNVLLTAGQTKEFDVPESIAVFVDKMQTLGTAVGEISIAFGDNAGSPFIDLYPGDLIRAAAFGKVRLRNNNAVALRSLRLIFSNDIEFMPHSPQGGNR